MSADLEKARKLADAGKYKQAIARMWTAEAASRHDGDEARAVLELASQIRDNVTGGQLRDAERLIELAERNVNTSLEEAWSAAHPTWERRVRAVGGIPGVTNGWHFTLLLDADGVRFGSEPWASWDQVEAIHVDGPDEIAARFTATRLLALGPLGLAFKKSKRQAETFITIEATSPGVALVAIEDARPVDIRGELLGVMNAYLAARPATPVNPVAPLEESSGPLEQIRKLGELRDQGVLTEEEFTAKKAELLQRL
ncbi:MAG: SHOCT domain-containing protein [Solirubrobacteraceae bacterium]